MVCKKLATDTMLDQMMRICLGRLPIETCTEGLAYKGLGCGVVAAESSIDFCQKLPPFLFGDAPLKDSDSAFLIKLSLMDFIGIVALCSVPHFGPRVVPVWLGRAGMVLSTG